MKDIYIIVYSSKGAEYFFHSMLKERGPKAPCSHHPSLFNMTNIHRTGLSGWPPQLAALMDSFATSQSFLHAVFSPDLSLMSARQASADSMSPVLPRWKDLWVWIEQRQDTCWRWVGMWEPCSLRSSENRNIDRLNRLNSETQLSNPGTDWPLSPQVTDIPANPWVVYLFA